MAAPLCDGGGGARLPLSLRLLSGLIKTANALIRRSDYTIRRWLGSIEEIRFPALSIPIYGVSTRDIAAPSLGDSCWARLFIPDDAAKSPSSSASLPVVIYYHGGGFAVLRPDFLLYDIFCRRLAKIARCIVVSVNYPLAPEHRYPAVHDSCFHFLKWLRSKEARDALPASADLSRCFLSGDSAGGNIAHFVACRAAIAEEQALLDPLRVRGSILIQPFFGSQERSPSEILLRNGPIINLEMTDWYWRAYLPDGEDRDHPICNVFGPRSMDITALSLPPSLVLVGEYDLLKDAQMSYAQGMAAAGKKVKVLLYKRGVHVFHIFYRLKSSRQCLSDIAQFIHETLA
ncbi:probable carboxylesterase 18 [Selaginella moellendorffii]|nr:probable carboxylesterase 18 [Selaginella moellendorffii]|eukprot:XP_002980705.2 probable carboxylesterase 18 [Selaginella moellendorffii]